MAKQLELFDRISSQENSQLELKSATGGVPKSFWETYSAFANTDGGLIVLGVGENDSGEPVFKGLDDPLGYKQDILNTMRGGQKVSVELLADESFELYEYEPGRHVLLIEIPRASRDQRPVYVGKDPVGGTYRRMGEGDYVCSADEVHRMFADRSTSLGDSEPMDGFTVQDLDAESVRQYRQIFQNRDPQHQFHGLETEEFLIRIGALVKDRKSGRVYVTRAGLLMFGSEQALHDPQAIPSYHVDYREKLATDPLVRWSHRIYDDGNWNHNIFQFYTRVINRIYSQLEQPYQVDETGGRVLETGVHLGLKEALVNALIHADYRGAGGIVIEKYRDRYEFSNPGHLLVSVDQLVRGGLSECRNKNLQRMFQYLGVGDKAGSGIERIRLSWENALWASPRLSETTQPDRVLLEMPTISILSEDVSVRLIERFGEETIRTLSPEEKTAVVYAEQHGQVTNSNLQGMLTLHRADITTLLKGLMSKGLLEKDGDKRGASYHLPSSPDKGPSSPDKGPSSPDKDRSSPDKDRSSPDKGPSSPDSDTSKRRSKSSTAVMVIDFCRGEFRTLSEIAQLLQRDEKYVRDYFLSNLIKNGSIELRYPDTPTHPQQAYRTATK